MRTLTAILALLTLAAGPATGPASKPTSRPDAKQRFSMMDGAVKYLIPAGWTESNRNDPEHVVQYNSPDGKASIVVGIVPQRQGIPEKNADLLAQMKSFVINGMTAKHKKNNDTMLYGPRSETDDRFYLRIHDRIKREDKTLDEVQLYRVAGLDLLMVLTSVKTDDAKEARAFQEIGEDVCLSMLIGPADKRKPAKDPEH